MSVIITSYLGDNMSNLGDIKSYVGDKQILT